MLSSDLIAGVLGIFVLFLLILLRVPIAFAFLIVGTSGVIYIAGFPAALQALMGRSWGWGANFIMLAIPLFILMGSFCFYGGISRDLYDVLYKLIGRWPGGLAMATVGACGAFAAVSASSLATTAAIGKVAYGEMRRFNYSPRLATGCIAAGGTLGSLIPPSILFIIYGVITDSSVGQLFMAGIFPGILEVLSYAFIIYIMARVRPSLAPPGPSFTWKERLIVLPRLLPAAGLSFLVVGGIYGGVFTPSEAAAVGAFTAFLYLVVGKRFTRQSFIESLVEAGRITGMLFLIIIGAMVFNTFMALSGLATLVSNWVIGLAAPGLLTVGLMLLLYIPLGMFMEAIAMISLTLPFFVPVFLAQGFSLIWIGVLVIRLIEIASITPPVGLTVFVMSAVAKDVPMDEIFRGVLPFFIMDILMVAILVFFPQISLFIPSTMMK